MVSNQGRSDTQAMKSFNFMQLIYVRVYEAQCFYLVFLPVEDPLYPFDVLVDIGDDQAAIYGQFGHGRKNSKLDFL